MENQTRFDLNASIESWRQELAAQVGLTAEVRRELETHLRDTVAGFQQRGLNDEESFWLARRRVGQPQQLDEEFVKANPAEVWRERVFWMVLAYLVFALWLSLVSCIPVHNWRNGFFGLLLIYAYALLVYLPVIGLAIILAKGQLNKRYYALADFFQSRWRFAVSAIVFLVLTHGYEALEAYKYMILMDGGRLMEHTLDGFWLNQISSIVWPLMLVVLATWLMPNQKTPRRV